MKPLRSREHRALCALLAEARSQAGLTQRDLALRLKRPHSYVAKIEGGERRIDVLEFIEVARALRIDPIKLFARVAS
jgi:transcriptional regulator with XRE-family HTH domain